MLVDETPDGPAPLASAECEETCDRLIAALSRPEIYGAQTCAVQQRETHISHLFLTDRYAYKLKKTVKLPFLDFSTVELRQTMCHAELRLNQRLTSQIYLSVEPVTWDGGQYRIGGHGRPVDYLVKMKRLPDENCLTALLFDQQASPVQLESLAVRLADFYRQLPPAPVTGPAYLQRLRDHITDNTKSLLEFEETIGLDRIRRLHGSQLQMLTLEPQLFLDRIAAGRLVEGHGDLRPDHIYFLPDPQIIDCLEFSTELRQVDILDELAFLEMECDRLHATAVGRQISRRIGQLLNDPQSERLRYFYKLYRACVRAKVAAIREHQFPHDGSHPESERANYGKLADEYQQHINVAFFVVVAGLMGTGKSTLAASLARECGAEYLSTDAIRRELFGQSNEHAAYGTGRYSRDQRRQVYDVMLGRATAMLARQLSVVLDGTFLTADLRNRATQVARDAGYPAIFLRCDCGHELAQQRIAERLRSGNSYSEARPDLQANQSAEQTPWEAEDSTFVVDTSGPASASLDDALNILRAQRTTLLQQALAESNRNADEHSSPRAC